MDVPVDVEAQPLKESVTPLFRKELKREGEDVVLAEVREPGLVRILRVRAPDRDGVGRPEAPVEQQLATYVWDGLALRVPEAHGPAYASLPLREQLLFDEELARAQATHPPYALHPAHRRDVEDVLHDARSAGGRLYPSKLREDVQALSPRAHAHLQSQLDAAGLRLETLFAFSRSLRVDDEGRVLRAASPAKDAPEVPALLDMGGLWADRGVGHDMPLVLTSSVLGALSYQQLHPTPSSRFLVIGPERGAEGSLARESEMRLVRQTLAAATHTFRVVLAFDADARGEALTREVRGLVPQAPEAFLRRVPTLGRTWDECLRLREPERTVLVPGVSNVPGLPQASALTTPTRRELPVSTLAHDVQQSKPLVEAALTVDGERYSLKMEQPGVVEVHGPFGQAALRWDGTKLTPANHFGEQVPEKLQRGMEQVLATTRQWGRAVEGPAQVRGIAEAMATFCPKGIRPETLDSPRFSHSFETSDKGQLRLPAYDRRGRQEMDGVWASAAKPSDKRLVFTSSVAEALAYHQLFPTENTRYVAIGPVGPDGSMTRAQREAATLAIASMPFGATIVGALGYERRAAHLAAELNALAPEATIRRHTPAMGHTFGEMVQRFERDFIRAQQPERGALQRSVGMER